MRKSIIRNSVICLISLLMLSLLGTVVFGYYQKSNSGWKQSYSITNIGFFVNGNSSDTNTFKINANKIDVEDGMNVDLLLDVRGSFTGPYVVNYQINFNNLVTDINDDMASVIEVYEKVDDGFQYISMLSDLYKSDINGYMGINDKKLISLLLVYAPNSNEKFASKKIKFEIGSTFSTEYANDKTQNYYIASSMIPIGSSKSLFELLEDNCSELSGKNLVLTEDVQFKLNQNIIFDNNVGIDLNGHILDLNGGSIKISYSNSFDKKVLISDSKHTGQLNNGNIIIDTPNDIIYISDSLDENITSKIIVSNSSLTTFKNLVQNCCDDYSKKPLKSNNQNIDIDISKNLKYYLKKNIFSINIVDENNVVIAHSNGKFSVLRGEEKTYYLEYVTISNQEESSSFSFVFNVLGTSPYSQATALLDSIPDVISGSLFLPSYDPFTNANYSWVTSDKNLLQNTGIYLPNGISSFDNFLNKPLTIGIIVELNGQRVTLTKDVEVELMSLEDRVAIFADVNQVIFSQVNQIYSLDISSQLLAQNSLANYGEVLNLLNSQFDINVTIDTSNNSYKQDVIDFVQNKYNKEISTDDEVNSYLDEYKAFLASKFLAEKIGLQGIDISTDSFTQLSNVNQSTNQLFLNYAKVDNADTYYYYYLVLDDKSFSDPYEIQVSITYQFATTDNSDERGTYLLDKSFIVSGKSNDEKLVDSLDEIRSPFIIYESKMSNLANPFEKEFKIKETTSQGDAISYEIIAPSNASNYINVIEKEQGTYIQIKPGLVPSQDTTISVSASVGTTAYAFSFVIPGIIHNNEEGIPDSTFYYKLLNLQYPNDNNYIYDLDYNHDGYIYTKEASRITYLDLSKGSNDISLISSIKGINYFKNLKKLILSNNNIIDISYMEPLVNLEYVDFSNNKISNISSLLYFDKLQTLNLANNSVVDLSPITYLKNITSLNLYANNVTSLEPLSDYHNLTYLQISNNINIATGNEYYYALLTNNSKDNGKTLQIYRNSTYSNNEINDGSKETISQEALTATRVLKNLLIINETFTSLYLPSSYEGKSLTWTSSNENILRFDSSLPGGYSIETPIVDTRITIGVKVNSLTISRNFYVNILQSPAIPDIAYIETATGRYERLCEVVEDPTLRSILFNRFNINNSPDTAIFTRNGYVYHEDLVITQTELNTILNSELSLNSQGIETLNGIGYFKGIKILNLSDNDISSLAPLQQVSSLKTLTLSGKYFDFDELIFDNNQVVNNQFSLSHLVLNGCYGLDDDETLTKLYHVYKNNHIDKNYVKIFLESPDNSNYDSATNYWDPFTIPLSKYASCNLPTYGAVVNLGDTITINKKHDIYFYDDTQPITFLLSTPVNNTNNLNVGDILGNQKNCIKISSTSDEVTLNYYKFAFTTDILYVRLTLKAEDTSLPASCSTYMQILVEFNKSCYVIDVPDDSGNIQEKTIDEVFPGRSLRYQVMEKLNGKTFSTTNKTTFYLDENNIKHVTLAGLKSLYGNNTSLTLSSDFDETCIIVAGLKFLSTVTKLKISRDASIGDGSELINIKEIEIDYSYVDFTKFSTEKIKEAAYLIYGKDTVNNNYKDTLAKGYLQIKIFNCPSLYGVWFYDASYKDNLDATTFTDPSIYYFNYLPNLTTIKLNKSNTLHILDFRFLRPYTLGNNITSLEIQSNDGSLYSSTRDILTDIYNNSSQSTKNFYISSKNGGGVNDKKLFSPSGNISYSQIEQMTDEYEEFSKNVNDLDVKIDGNLHYLSSTQIMNNSISLPLFVNPYKVITADNNELIINDGKYDNTEESYRNFYIDWYIICTDINRVMSIFNNSLIIDQTFAVDYPNQGSSLKRYKITSSLEIYNIINKPQYDIYFIIEGVIGNKIAGIDVPDLTKYVFDYPVVVKGTKAYDSGNNYAYTDGDNIYYSYLKISDLSLRMAVFVNLESGVYCSDITGLIKYQSSSIQAKDLSTFDLNDIYNLLKNYYSGKGYSYGLHNQITSVITLSGMEIFNKITKIKISGTHLADIYAVKAMTNLQEIDFSVNYIYDISPVKNLNSLTIVNISKNNLENTYEVVNNDFISYFKNSGATLQKLYINDNAAININDLRALIGDYNPVTKDYSGYNSLVLNEFNFYNTYITVDIEWVSCLNQLTNYINSQQIAYGINDSTNIITQSKSEWINTFNEILGLIASASIPTAYTEHIFNGGTSYNVQLDTVIDGELNATTYKLELRGSFLYIQGIFNINILYSIPINSKTLKVSIPYACYINQNTKNELIKTIIYNGNSSALKNVTNIDDLVYKVDNEIVDAFSLFDENLVYYFINNATYITNLADAASNLNFIFYHNDAGYYLIITNSFTSLAIASNLRIKSLKGLEIIPSLTSINIKENYINELPNFTNNTKLTNLIIINNSAFGGYLTTNELLKITELKSLTKLDLTNLEGEFNKNIDAIQKNFMAYIATKTSITELYLNVTSKMYATSNAQYNQIDYAETFNNFVSMYGSANNPTLGNLFNLTGAKKISSYTVLKINRVYRGGSNSDQTNIFYNTYFRTSSNFLQTKLNNRFDNTGMNCFSFLSLADYANGFPYIFGVIYSNDNTLKRYLPFGELMLTDSKSLPTKIISNGYTYSIVWTNKNDNSNNVKLTNNVITITDKASISTVSEKMTITCGDFSSYGNIEFKINTVINEDNTTVKTNDTYVEVEDGVYKKSSEVFESGRLQAAIFYQQDNSNQIVVKDSSNKGLTINDKNNTNEITVTIDGREFITYNCNVLTQKEIKAVYSLGIRNIGCSSIKGVEIFKNLKEFSFVSRAVNSIEPLRNLKLEKFSFSSIESTAGNGELYTLRDFTPLLNSYDTLKSFEINTKITELTNNNTFTPYTYADFTFLTCFNDQLKNIKICSRQGFLCLKNTIYLASWYSINRPNTIVELGEASISSESSTADATKTIYTYTITNEAKKAADILSNLNINEATVSQQVINNCNHKFNSVLRLTKDEDGNLYGYLPNEIDVDGLIYDVTWEKFSSLVNIEIESINGVNKTKITVNNPTSNFINSTYIGCNLVLNNVMYSRVFTILCYDL